MKKALAIMLAAAATMSMSLVAMAEDVSAIETSSVEATSSEEATSSDATSSEETSSDATSSEDTSSDETVTPAPIGEPTELVFGADASTGAVLGETLLETGTEYKFPVSIKDADGNVGALTEAMMKDYKFAYTRVSGSGVSTLKIEENRGTYYLYVEMKAAAPTKEIDVKYNVRMVKKASNLSLFTQAVSFSYGYAEADSDYVNSLDKGDIVEIDNNNPIITKNQFETIAKINDYRNVTLSGPSWAFTVNVTDESTKNMVSNNAGIKEILSNLPDQDFKFFNFPGTPTFTATGKVALDVEDIVDDFDKMYAYRYANGKLYRLNASFNSEDNTLEFRTNTLDKFVVTNVEIKDGLVINENDNSSSNGTSSDDTNKGNPETGASDMINVAVMAAIASLAGAGMIATRKNSKKK